MKETRRIIYIFQIISLGFDPGVLSFVSLNILARFA